MSTVNVAGMSGSQYVNQWIRPHFWFVVYADPQTCSKEAPPVNEIVEFEMEFLNPDSSGTATDHFGDELRGLAAPPNVNKIAGGHFRRSFMHEDS